MKALKRKRFLTCPEYAYPCKELSVLCFPRQLTAHLIIMILQVACLLTWPADLQLWRVLLLANDSVVSLEEKIHVCELHDWLSLHLIWYSDRYRAC